MIFLMRPLSTARYVLFRKHMFFAVRPQLLVHQLVRVPERFRDVAIPYVRTDNLFPSSLRFASLLCAYSDTAVEFR